MGGALACVSPGLQATPVRILASAIAPFPWDHLFCCLTPSHPSVASAQVSPPPGSPPFCLSLTRACWVASLGSAIPTWLTELLLRVDCGPCKSRARAVSTLAVSVAWPSTRLDRSAVSELLD